MTLIPNVSSLLMNTLDVPSHLEHNKDFMVWLTRQLFFFMIFQKNPFFTYMYCNVRDIIAIYIPRQSKFIHFFDLYGVVWPSNLVVDKQNGIFQV